MGKEKDEISKRQRNGVGFEMDSTGRDRRYFNLNRGERALREDDSKRNTESRKLF